MTIQVGTGAKKKKKIEEDVASEAKQIALSESIQNTISNPDGSKTVIPKGESAVNLSAQEHKAFIGEPGGAFTRKVMQLKNISDNQALKAEISSKLKKGATIQQITRDLLMEQAKINQASQLPQDETLTPDQSPTTPPLSRNKATFPEPWKPGDPVKTSKEQIKELEQTFDALLEPNFATDIIGKIYDVVTSVARNGKGLEQKNAEVMFSDMKSSLENDMALVRQGLRDPQDVKNKIIMAREANIKLDNSVKGLNRINIRYFITHGEDVRTQVLANQDYLDGVEKELEDAILEGKLIEAKLNYGLNTA